MQYKLINHDNKFFLITPDRYEDATWEVIGLGITKEEAFQHAFENMFNTYKNLFECVSTAYNILSEESQQGIFKDSWYPTTIEFSIGKHECEEIGEDKARSFSYYEQEKTFIPISEYFQICHRN